MGTETTTPKKSQRSVSVKTVLVWLGISIILSPFSMFGTLFLKEEFGLRTAVAIITGAFIAFMFMVVGLQFASLWLLKRLVPYLRTKRLEREARSSPE
ncbi:hypothetical protein HOI18_00850 [Candidatus Uhrbacteria bacterium]|jgi:hypothetical protein|nr:hypothetical protein [Candidatus Uhrbacteria bacterium]